MSFELSLIYERLNLNNVARNKINIKFIQTNLNFEMRKSPKTDFNTI